MAKRKGTRTTYPHTREEMCRFGIVLTDEELEKYAAKHTVTKRDLKDDVCDSFDRDFLIFFVVNDVLGEGYHWPLNGDSDEYTEGFYAQFYKAAREKGIQVIDGIDQFAWSNSFEK